MKTIFISFLFFAFSAMNICAQEADVESIGNADNDVVTSIDKTQENWTGYRFKPTHNLFRFGYGFGTITSKVINEHGREENYNTKDYQVDYEHVWGRTKPQGFGVNFSKSIIDGGYNEVGGFEFVYFGASYVTNYTTTLGWNWTCGLGLGYAGYSDHYTNLNGVGFLAHISCDYKFSRYFGIGADLRYRVDRYETPDGVQLDNNESFGFNTLSIMFGPRIYF